MHPATAAVEAAARAERRCRCYNPHGELGWKGGCALLERHRGEGDAAVPHGAEVEAAVDGAERIEAQEGG